MNDPSLIDVVVSISFDNIEEFLLITFLRMIQKKLHRYEILQVMIHG